MSKIAIHMQIKAFKEMQCETTEQLDEAAKVLKLRINRLRSANIGQKEYLKGEVMRAYDLKLLEMLAVPKFEVIGGRMISLPDSMSPTFNGRNLRAV